MRSRPARFHLLDPPPGQAGVVAATSTAAERLPELRKDYRLVTVDQRGTGALGALNCPKLQAQTGSSDIATPSRDAVQECAGILGATARFYGTDQTVADLDQLRQALGVRKMVIDGTSYGSTVAARYAIAHPANTRKVVLDSVLPHHLTAADSFYLTGLTAEARVLRDACATAPACGFDPTFRNPDVPGMPAGVGDAIGAVHAAAGGDRTGLDALLTTLAPGGDDVARFSSGLHAATVCSDFRFPWGDSSTPVAGRRAALDRAEATLAQARTFPYTPGVATHQGFVQTCLPWPAEKPGSNPGGRLPNVPVLLLSGTHDLSTPTEWARQELAQAPQGKLVIVPGASHSIQNRETGRVGRDAVIAFLEP
ncbi:alpha/beta fold hydrolase [Streptomyces sp. 150FB]|uniref:alpha/beta hydrolase n=1 Tax=Streptomyces sp. 150FB TaxID=1576605 RepID=UPI000A748985|nr:alpha/beta fold hydrolase [Streptomyces sp. 150FB]